MPAGDGGRRPLPGHLDPRLGRDSPRSARQQPPRREGGRPRRGSRAAAIARLVAGLLSLVLLAGSGWGWYLARVAQASLNRTDAIPGSGNSDVNGSGHAGNEMNLLLVGMDSRTGLTAEQQAEYSTGDPDGVLNTDSMMLVHVPADGSGASFVSLPRDTYVDIPGYGQGRLNSAYARGYNASPGTDAESDAAGAQLLIQTVSQFTGLQIDHFAEINLLGFINLSNIVGGVEVNLCQATSDPYSGANFPAGVQTITGADALKFVRQRHGLPGVDLDRVVRQQVYIAGMLRNLLSSNVLLDLGKQKQIVEQVGSSLTVDKGLDLFDLASQMQGVQPGDITFQTVPGLTPTRIDGNDVLEPPSDDEVKAFFASLTKEPADDEPAEAPETVAPSEFSVAVQNGSGVSGAAATAAEALSAAGFDAASDGNADATDTTTIRYRSGDEGAAATLAAQVPGAAQVPDDSLPSGTVQLVIGADFNGIGQPVTVASADDSGDTGADAARTAEDTSCIN